MAASDFCVRTGVGAVRCIPLLDLVPIQRVDSFWAREDIRAVLGEMFHADEAVLVMHEDRSWAVVERHEDDTLFVLGAVCTRRGTLEEGAAYFNAVARHLGCARVEFGSHRKGWAKRAAALGYHAQGDGYFGAAVT